MTETKKGEIYIFLETLLWALFPVITLLSFSSLKPLASLALSTLSASVFFGFVITKKKLWKEVFSKTARKEILLGTLFVGVIFYLLQFFGISHTTAGNAALISQMEIFFSFLVFNVYKKEYFDTSHIFGALLMLLGALIILLPKSSQINPGDIFILLSTVAAPLGNVFQQKAMKKVSSFNIMFWRNTLSFPIFFLLMFIYGQNFSGADLQKSLWLVIFSGVFLFGISKILWLEAIHRIPVVKANALNCIGPLFTIIFAYFLLKQSPTIWQLLAVLPLSLGILILTKPSKKH